jgi:large subunit ribosomal protein L7/L12
MFPSSASHKLTSRAWRLVGGVVGAAARLPTTRLSRSCFHTTASVSDKVQPNNKIELLFQRIIWLDMFEVHLLTELLQEKMGMSGIQMATSIMGVGNNKDEASEDEEAATPVVEKTTFDLKLLSFDAKNKIKVIKEVRAIAGLGLKEAKEMVESAPTVIKKDIKKEQAQELQKKLEDIGATIEVV